MLLPLLFSEMFEGVIILSVNNWKAVETAPYLQFNSLKQHMNEYE
jgi:hypothetical protein